jgi:hypothetical protein
VVVVGPGVKAADVRNMNEKPYPSCPIPSPSGGGGGVGEGVGNIAKCPLPFQTLEKIYESRLKTPCNIFPDC